jgi:hypothetical protein
MRSLAWRVELAILFCAPALPGFALGEDGVIGGMAEPAERRACHPRQARDGRRLPLR